MSPHLAVENAKIGEILQDKAPLNALCFFNSSDSITTFGKEYITCLRIDVLISFQTNRFIKTISSMITPSMKGQTVYGDSIQHSSQAARKVHRQGVTQRAITGCRPPSYII